MCTCVCFFLRASSKYCIHFLFGLCSNFSSGRFNSSLFQGGGDGIAMAASEYHLGMQTLQHTSTYISTSAAGETSFVFSSGGSVPDYELGHKTDCKSYFEFARGK